MTAGGGVISPETEALLAHIETLRQMYLRSLRPDRIAALHAAIAALTASALAALEESNGR